MTTETMSLCGGNDGKLMIHCRLDENDCLYEGESEAGFTFRVSEISSRPVKGEFALLAERQYTMEKIPEDDFELFKVKTAFNEENALIVTPKGRLLNMLKFWRTIHEERVGKIIALVSPDDEEYSVYWPEKRNDPVELKDKNLTMSIELTSEIICYQE